MQRGKRGIGGGARGKRAKGEEKECEVEGKQGKEARRKIGRERGEKRGY